MLVNEVLKSISQLNFPSCIKITNMSKIQLIIYSCLINTKASKYINQINETQNNGGLQKYLMKVELLPFAEQKH